MGQLKVDQPFAMTGEKPEMIRSMLCCVSILALVMTAGVARAEQVQNKQAQTKQAQTKQVQTKQAKDKPALPGAGTNPIASEEDCETRIRRLEASTAEGEERLAAKNEVIDFCSGQYKRDKTVDRLVKECAKYAEQPVVKQQAVAECQLAAFSYANVLRTLKAEVPEVEPGHAPCPLDTRARR